MDVFARNVKEDRRTAPRQRSANPITGSFKIEAPAAVILYRPPMGKVIFCHTLG
jgi:hypothetical protein